MKNSKIVPVYSEIDTESPGLTERSFREEADLDEGVSGRADIDTTYDMPRQDIVQAPRSTHLHPEHDEDKPWRCWCGEHNPCNKHKY